MRFWILAETTACYSISFQTGVPDHENLFDIPENDWMYISIYDSAEENHKSMHPPCGKAIIPLPLKMLILCIVQ
jgi:hypothetical protein